MAHMPNSTIFPYLFLLLFFHLVSLSGFVSSEDSQAGILLKFKDSLQNTDGLSSWKDSSTPCNGNLENWVGVMCENGSIWGLKLENMGLKGSIDVGVLKDLPGLRSLSLMSNNFEGSLPDFGQLGALKSLYLSNNKFSGVIADDVFLKMLSLKKVHLAHNQFTGAIPQSLRFLPKLMELRLESNDFQGNIPDFLQKTWLSFNVSNNELNGQIPTSLNSMDKSSFAGNKDLCGKPLKSCSSDKPSLISIVVVVIVVFVALTAICAVVFILCRRNQYNSSSSSSIEAPRPITAHKKISVTEQNQAAGAGSTHTSPDRSTNGSTSGGKKADSLKLSFVRDDRQRFDMQDLLRASAEILGSGCFGSSYKAALLSGPVMVVKRFKQMNNVGREEFQEHMRRIGRLRHPNLLPLVAYYYKKEEKLLVSDYIQKGSLAVQLHGNQALGQPCLDWTTRLKIIKGVGKGLLYLYNELPSLIAAHGHLKSSNVLLNENFEPLLTDYGLIPVINQEHGQELMVAYKSPEYAQYGRITKKTDVWELGMLILEMLTGKFPARFLQKGKGNEEEDLAGWVKSVPEEEWGNVVFDKELGTARSSIGEMLRMLKIGLGCCEGDVDKRWDLKEAVRRIEDVKDKDGIANTTSTDHEDFYSSRGSEADMRSIRGLSDDFNFS
ncbi:pollen receptor-like kinase 1 [Ziziphus jujuba]|uniref:Pollen receptor-like kinase 1 n=1 Tax=Ziziphus jujuba TaxID=326968 RepID=A0A6P4A7H6_ZIZJJ|nr:pollen receptor-like kinase 1 [Ziziphus jujuba]